MIVSYVMFVLVGTLLGHLIWYRDRSDDAARMAQMESRYRKMRAIVRGRKNEHAELARDLTVARSDMESIREENISLARSARELEVIKNEAIAEAELLRQQKAAAEENAGKEATNRDQLLSELATAGQSKATAEREAIKCRSEADRLTQQLAQSNHDHAATQHELKQSTEQHRSIQQALDAERERATTLQTENQALAAEVGDLRTNSEKSLKAVFDESALIQQQLTQQIAAQDELIAGLTNEREAEVAELQARIRENDTAEAVNASNYQKQLDTLSKELADVAKQYTTKLKTANSTIERLNEQCRDLQAQLDDRSNQSTELTQTIIAHGEELKSVTLERDELFEQVEQSREKCTQLQAQLDDGSNQSTELSQTIAAHGEELKSLKLEREGLLKQVQESGEQCTLLLSQLDSGAKKSADLNKTLAAQTEELNGLHAERDELLNQLDAANELREAAAQKSDQIKQLIAQRDSSMDKVNDLETLLGEVNTKLVARDETVKTLEQSIKEIGVERDAVLAKLGGAKDSNAKMQQQIEAKTTELAELQATAERLKDLEHQRDEAVLKLQSAGDTIGSLQKSLNVKSTEMQASLQQSAKAEKVNEQLRADSESLRTQIAQLTSELDGLEKLRPRLAEVTSELEIAHQKANQLESEVGTLRAENQAIAKQAQLIDSLKQQQSQTKQQLTESVEEHLETAKRLETQTKAANSFQQQLKQFAGLESTIASLRAQLESTTGHLRQVTEDYNASLDSNSEAEQRIVDLQKRLSDGAATIRDLRRVRGPDVETTVEKSADYPNVLPFQRKDEAA